MGCARAQERDPDTRRAAIRPWLPPDRAPSVHETTAHRHPIAALQYGAAAIWGYQTPPCVIVNVSSIATRRVFACLLLQRRAASGPHRFASNRFILTLAASIVAFFA